jgi:hypothetical protein
VKKIQVRFIRAGESALIVELGGVQLTEVPFAFGGDGAPQDQNPLLVALLAKLQVSSSIRGGRVEFDHLYIHGVRGIYGWVMLEARICTCLRDQGYTPKVIKTHLKALRPVRHLPDKPLWQRLVEGAQWCQPW